MKTVTFTLRGQKYGLYYNGAAMFDVQDVLGGDTTQLFTVIRGRSREKFAKLCEMIEIMSAQYNKAMAVVADRPRSFCGRNTYTPWRRCATSISCKTW